MKIWELKSASGSRKQRVRVGRGHGSGLVKTSGRGGKGQTARSGGGKGPGFEGGQTPWYRRLPKLRGFKPLKQVEFAEVTLKRLAAFPKEKEVTPEALYEAGFIKNLKRPVKILGTGELHIPLIVKVHKVTEGAKIKIEACGGKVEVVKE